MNLRQAWEQQPKEKTYCEKCGEITLHEIYAGKKSCLRCRAAEFGKKVDENKKKAGY